LGQPSASKLGCRYSSFSIHHSSLTVFPTFMPTPSLPPVSSLIGLLWDEAQPLLSQTQYRVVETASPPRKHAQHTFGALRVLRVRHTDDQILEITLARELLAEAPRRQP
jgi:hypothetical protein